MILRRRQLSLCGHLQLIYDEGEVSGGSAFHIEVEVMARVVPTHQGVLAIGPHIEHVKDAVTKQRRLDAKLVKIKSQLENFNHCCIVLIIRP